MRTYPDKYQVAAGDEALVSDKQVARAYAVYCSKVMGDVPPTGYMAALCSSGLRAVIKDFARLSETRADRGVEAVWREGWIAGAREAAAVAEKSCFYVMIDGQDQEEKSRAFDYANRRCIQIRDKILALKPPATHPQAAPS